MGKIRIVVSDEAVNALRVLSANDFNPADVHSIDPRFASSKKAIWLEPHTVERLKTAMMADESFSDALLRIAQFLQTGGVKQ